MNTFRIFSICFGIASAFLVLVSMAEIVIHRKSFGKFNVLWIIPFQVVNILGIVASITLAFDEIDSVGNYTDYFTSFCNPISILGYVLIDLNILEIFGIINSKFNKRHVSYAAVGTIVFFLLCYTPNVIVYFYDNDVLDILYLIGNVAWPLVALIYDNGQIAYLTWLTYKSNQRHAYAELQNMVLYSTPFILIDWTNLIIYSIFSQYILAGEVLNWFVINSSLIGVHSAVQILVFNQLKRIVFAGRINKSELEKNDTPPLATINYNITDLF
ncbi:hypothetical protein HDV04_000636 [Boothiomyces sp. JEL0838]|nr:hypothetical protein HDV04_000636 [Boothiomyces sp. JEL0838]